MKWADARNGRDEIFLLAAKCLRRSTIALVRVRTISQSMPAKLRETISNIELKEIGKTDVDTILKTASGVWDVSNGVTKHYLDQVT